MRIIKFDNNINGTSTNGTWSKANIEPTTYINTIIIIMLNNQIIDRWNVCCVKCKGFQSEPFPFSLLYFNSSQFVRYWSSLCHTIPSMFQNFIVCIAVGKCYLCIAHQEFHSDNIGFKMIRKTTKNQKKKFAPFFSSCINIQLYQLSSEAIRYCKVGLAICYTHDHVNKWLQHYYDVEFIQIIWLDLVGSMNE